MKSISFHKETLAADAYLCFPGPSLKYLNPDALKKPGVLTFAVNNAYPYVRPDVWFGMDDPQCYHREIFWESFIKIMRGGYQDRLCEDRLLDNCFNLFYADCLASKDDDYIFQFKGHDVKFAWRGNVTATALHIIMWMGVKRIHLIGCDFSQREGDYYDKKISLSIANKEWNKALYSQLNDYFKWFSFACKSYGVELISCTPDSKINEYLPYLPVDSATERTQQLHNIPFGGELTHSKDTNKKI